MEPNDPYVAPVIARIGDISVTSDTIMTPTGNFPLRESQWTAQDQWVSSQRIPRWAIICAIAGFCCLTVFSLFFLLAKEMVYTGWITVTVTDGSHYYVTRIQVATAEEMQEIYDRINYVRSLAAL